MEVTREKGMESGYDYVLQQDNAILRIAFGSNLDLYWSITKLEEDRTLDHLYDEQYESFLITKENHTIYTLFKKLVDDIKIPRVFEPIQKEIGEDEVQDVELEEIADELNRRESDAERCVRWNDELKTSERYMRLYDGTDIIWRSDDDYFEIADCVKISEVDGNILLEFYRPKTTIKTVGFRMPGTITIRFRNSGSTYDPLNIVFMKMYQQLQQYNPDYHQIHMEEIEYQKTLRK